MSDEPRALAPDRRALAVRRGLTRTEWAQLRRGELDADVVAALMDISAGLAAPAPPPEGDLIPNGTGWRLSQGTVAERMHPRLWGLAMRSGVVLFGFGATQTTLLGIHSLLATTALSVAPLVLFMGALNVSVAIKLHPLRRAPRPPQLADCPPGTTVRLQGVVVSDATVPTLFRGAPAVLFKSVVGSGHQTQGIDFDLQLEGGERVRIAVRRAMLLDRPLRTREPPACGPVRVDWASEPGRPRLASDVFTPASLLSRLRAARWRHEAAIAPGDRIEVCGVLHQEPDPDGRAPFSRQLPVRTVIRAGNELPLLVRRLG